MANSVPQDLDEQLARMRATAAKRIRYTFTVPIGLAKKTGVSSLTFVELETDEELSATRRAGNDALRLAFELSAQSVVLIDKDPVNLSDGSYETRMAMIPEGRSKLRQLMMSAYTVIHNPEGSDQEDFLKSQSASGG